MRRYLPFIIVIIVGMGVVAAGTLLFRAKRSQMVAMAPISKTNIKTDEGAIHSQGDANAPVTLVEFGDFECPPCGRVAAATDRITEGYGNQLRMVFRHFPLAAHKHAIAAAQASEAADLQGRFWEMHGLLYQTQEEWRTAEDVREVFAGYATRIGLDVDRFKADMESPLVNERIDADQRHGVSLGVTSTPAIFVNNHNVPMPADVVDVRAAIDAALKATPTPAPTP